MRAFRKIGEVRQRLQIDESGLTVEETGSRLQIEWFALKRFVESPAVFLLYGRQDEMSIIPKRDLTSSDIEALRHLMRERLTGSTRGFPVTGGPAS